MPVYYITYDDDRPSRTRRFFRVMPPLWVALVGVGLAAAAWGIYELLLAQIAH